MTRWTWAVPLLLLGGCDVIRFDDFVKQHATVTRTEPEPPGDHCAHGGHAVLAGEDTNDDGHLSADEVDSAEYVCASAPPSVVQRTREEAAGARCEHGGRAVETGIDADRNGLLDDAEVAAEATEYGCATTFPGVLVRTRQVPRGATCPLGGQLTQAGNDTNQDGVLSDDEITREVHGCLEPEPVLSRVVLLGTRYNSECGNRDVYAVESGPDLDQDGTLDDDELRAVSRICNPPAPILTRQQAEAPGVNCFAGGVAVVLGGDTNKNEVLEDDEVQTRHYVCQASTTHDGTYELLDVTDVAALQHISRIRGGLIISSQVAAEVVLPTLESVEGSLDIHDNPLLVRVELPALRFVRDDLSLDRNPLLSSVTFGTTTFPPSREVLVGGVLKVRWNARLVSMAGMSGLSPRQGIDITDNAILDSTGAFTFVESLGGVHVTGNPALRDLPLPQVTFLGSLYIADNPSLQSLGGLRKLRTVQYSASILRNEALENISALESLESVGLDFEVVGNPRLRRLELPGLTRVGNFVLEDNATLDVLGPMRGLRDVGFSFRIVGNARLYQVIELNSLRSISGGLSIASNPALVDLSGFEPLAVTSSVAVEGNHSLMSLAGLRGLREVEGLQVRDNPNLTELRLDSLAQVRVGFMVTGNENFPSCLATRLAEAVHTGSLDERVIESNDETASCPPP